MSKLTMTAFVTLDGIMQAPGGPTEDQSGGFAHGGWVVPLFDEELGGFIDEVFARVGGFLLGRRTYEIFASHWPHVTDPTDRVAAALNRLPKYVATRTLDRLEWSGSSVVRDVPAEVARLKREGGGGELQVHGSAGLAQTLLAEGLIDELNVIQFPLVLGGGKRLFGAGTVATAFELVAPARTTGRGVVIGTYRRAGRPAVGSAELEDGATKMRS
jgi:dihydrofolate reductase